MIDIVIVDDEQPSLEMATHLCNTSGLPLTVSGSASTISEGVRLIQQLSPQLVLLDIEFPEGTGFDLLDELSGMDFTLIFMTAHEHYAIQAIKRHALDYLLKPLEKKEFNQSMERALDRVELALPQQWTKLMKMLKEEKDEKFVLPISDGYRYVRLNDIVFIKADGSYAHVQLVNGESMLISKKLSWFEKRLDTKGFIRVQRSYLVHQDHITELHRNDGRYLVTSTNHSIPVSKSFHTLGNEHLWNA